MVTYVAVYGILRSDVESWYGAAPVMEEFADEVGPCRIPGVMYSVSGAFPALLPVEVPWFRLRKPSVAGQLWKVREGRERLAFRTLDEIEGYREGNEGWSMYLRRVVTLVRPRKVRASVYIWNGRTDGLAPVPGGDWKPVVLAQRRREGAVPG